MPGARQGEEPGADDGEPERQDERAARLFGAAEAHRTRSGVVPSIADHPALRAIRAAAIGGVIKSRPARSGARFRVGGASR